MFQKKIGKMASHPVYRDHVLSDGTYSCTYGDLPGIFDKMDAWFEKETSSSYSLMLRCGNSLAETLTLLWALSRKKSVFLLPRVNKLIIEEFENNNFHPFCQYKIWTKEGNESIVISEPGSYLHSLINPNFIGKDEDGRGNGLVYLRTSGSTAEPKLVLHESNLLYQNAENCTQRFSINPHDRILIPVPIYHMYGLGAGLLPAVIAGASISLMENTNIITYLDREKKFQPHVAFLTPSLISMFLQARKSTYLYRMVVTAGDRIGQTHYRQFEEKFGTLINLYGSTELGAIATALPGDSLELREKGDIATMPGAVIGYEQAKDHHVGEDQEIAEIYCQHAYGLRGYVDKQGKPMGEETSRFRTMDLGREVDEGHFRVCGRTGNAMNRNGILVAFLEVESLMEQGIDNLKSIVVLAKDELGARGCKMVAFCEIKDGVDMTGGSIRSACFSIMQRHMVPDEVVVTIEIPRLANGKFDRKKLAELLKTA